MAKLTLQPIEFDEACDFIRMHHRHHEPPQGWKFGTAVSRDEVIIGVVMVGRPVSRHRQDGYTLEVIRLCTTGTIEERRNAASKLYAAAWRAARNLGYRKLGTYILETESGVSLRAAGWKEIGRTGGGSWNVPSRPRVDKAPTMQKTLWEVSI